MDSNQLLSYSADFIAPALRGEDFMSAVTEEAPQIYSFPLFTPEFCQSLIQQVEAKGTWMNEPSLDTHPPLHFLRSAEEDAGRLNRPLRRTPRRVRSKSDPDQCAPLSAIEGLDAPFKEVADRHLAPLIKNLWPDFDLQIYDHPYLLKYEASLSRGMDLHVDEEPLALICYLNDQYEGGGTHFPKFDYCTGKKPVGTAVIYPGQRSHKHAGLPILEGVRYLFLMAFF